MHCIGVMAFHESSLPWPHVLTKQIQQFYQVVVVITAFKKIMGNKLTKSGLRKFQVNDVEYRGKELGRGIYGTVYEIKSHGKQCAGKVFHEEFFPKLADSLDMNSVQLKYLQECQLMSELNHPNITKFIGVCCLEMITLLPVVLMEMLPQNLDDYLQNTMSTVSLARKISILQDVANGLVYLHDHQPPIVHRDLTARNVLLTKDLRAKITDFRNSCFADIQPGKLPALCQGTPTLFYLPQEANENTPYDPSLDIFSFGHLALYVTLLIFPGELPEPTYTDQNSGEVVKRSEVERRKTYFNMLKTQDELVRQSQEDSRIYVHPLVGTIEKCLANDPKERYNAKDLLAKLDEMNTSEDINEWLGELIQHWNLKTKRPVVLVVAGKTGVGKSTLLNNFLGLKDNSRANTGLDGHSITSVVTEYTAEVNGITVKIIDTPGLCAKDLPETQVKETIAMLNAYTNGGKADLLLYCAAVVGGRIDEGNVNTIKILTGAFKEKIWEQCILVLTHADTALDEHEADLSMEDSMKCLEPLIKSYCTAFKDALIKAGVSNIKSVHNGFSTQNIQPDLSTIVAMPAGRTPNKPKEWISMLFREVLKKCDPETIPAMFTLQGMSWKKMSYILSMNYIFRVTNLTIETANDAIRRLKLDVPMKALFPSGIEYATIVRAKAIVDKKRKAVQSKNAKD